MEILAKGLPFADNVFDEFLSNDPICVLRLLHYPAQTSQNPRQLGAGAHTDFGKQILIFGRQFHQIIISRTHLLMK